MISVLSQSLHFDPGFLQPVGPTVEISVFLDPSEVPVAPKHGATLQPPSSDSGQRADVLHRESAIRLRLI